MYHSAAIILSPFCDNDCIFCHNRPRRSSEELRAQEIMVRSNMEHHLAWGAQDIEISGGDPGEFDRLPELIRDIKNSGIKTVRLSTNGFRCADKKWARALADAGLDAVKIPLYGPTAAIHEQVARKPGCFAAAVQALEHFLSLDVGIAINTLIVRQNQESLIELHQLMLSFADWRRCFFSVPCQEGEDVSFYVPIKALSRHIIPLVYYGAMNNTPPVFSELPRCVFSFEYPYINQGGPPRQGLQQPPPQYRSDIEDIPTYRLKSKPPMCAQCRLQNKCDGFFANDLQRYGTGDLQPFL